MAWETLKSAVTAVITANGNEEITGQILQDLLNNNIIEQLGDSLFKGIAELNTNPGTPENKQFYIAYKNGIYPNFGGIEVSNELVFLQYLNNTWEKHKMYDFSLTPLHERIDYRAETTVVTSDFGWIYDKVFKIPKNTNYQDKYFGLNLDATNKKTYLKAVSTHNHTGTLKGSGGTTIEVLNWVVRADGKYEYIYKGDLSSYTSVFLYFTDTTLHNVNIDVYFEEFSKYTTVLLENNIKYLNDVINKVLDVGVSKEIVNKLTLANGSTVINNGFQIPASSTGNDTYWLINKSLFQKDDNLKVGNIIKLVVEIQVTNYNEISQPQSWQIIEQKFRDGSQISTAAANYNYQEQISSGNLTHTITIEHIVTQEDLDNENYYRFYLGFKNTNTVSQSVNVTLESVNYTLHTGLSHLIGVNKDSLKNRVIKPNQKIITVSRHRSAADFNGRNAIQDVINSLTGLSEENQVTIQIGENTFDALIDSQFNYDAERNYYHLAKPKDWVNLQGKGMYLSTLLTNLDNNLGGSFAYELYKTLYFENSGFIKDLGIILRAGRYAIHRDGGFAGLNKDKSALMENIFIWHKGNTGDALARWGVGTPFGHGSNDGETLIVRNCVFRHTQNFLYGHNNYDFDKPSITIYEHPKAIMESYNADGAVVWENLGSNQSCIFQIVGQLPIVTPIKLVYKSLSITNLKADSSDTIVKLHDTLPMAVRNYNCDDMCLRIDTIATGASATVRFDQTASAFNDLIGDSADFVVKQNKYFHNQQYKYAYKDGVQSLSGFAYGYWNIKEDTVQSTNIHSLGYRLGDCTSVNKTLVITINGTDYTITFNQDYTAQSNADIIADINAVIGAVATASEFKVAREYYPEFKGVKHLIYEDIDSANAVGSPGFMMGNGKVRKATNQDTIDNPSQLVIMLDKAGNGDVVRCIPPGSRIERYSTGARFKVNEPFVQPLPKPVGHSLGISTTTPGLFDVNASPKVLKCFEQDVYKLIN
jgi:hypothetical protein